MIEIRCEHCGYEHKFSSALGGLTVHCKECGGWVQVPSKSSVKTVDEAITVSTPTSAIAPQPISRSGQARALIDDIQLSPSRDVDHNAGVASAPPGIQDWLIENWLETWLTQGMASGEMMTKLVERGCSAQFANERVDRFLEHRSRLGRFFFAKAEIASLAGMEGLTEDDFKMELNNGGRFVVYSYCISLGIVSMKRPSAVQFIRGIESRFLFGLPYTLISMLLGWWGIPWGIIYTIGCIASNCAGGEDVTDEVLARIGWHGVEGQPL